MEGCGVGTLLGSGESHSNRIYNNVYVNSGGIRPSVASTWGVDFDAYNNIFVSSDTFLTLVDDHVPGIFDFNFYAPFTEVRRNYGSYFTGLAAWQTATGLDAHSIESADAPFVDGTYHLRADSGAVGAGRDGVNMGLYPHADTTVVIGAP